MRIVLLCLLLLSACGGAAKPKPPPPALAPPAPVAAFPDGFDIAVLWKFSADAGGELPRIRLRIDPAGRPFAVADNRVVPLARLPSGDDARGFEIAGGRVTDIAWVDNGVLLVVADRTLGLALDRGIARIAELPQSGMRIARAAKDRCWVYGGASEPGALYLYDRSKGLQSLISFPEPVRAIAGTPERAHVATKGSIVRVAVGSPMQLVYDGDDEILALADAAGAGVFFSTRRGVFYLRDDGALLHLTTESARELQASDDALYMVYDGVGIARGAPLSVFRALPAEERT